MTSLIRLPTVIGINPQDRKREERACPLEGSQHRLPAAMHERKAFCPPGGSIGEREPCTGSHLRCRYHSGRARSASKKPGRVSSHSAKVRTGICCLSRVPDRVVERPRLTSLRWERRRRSAVAALMESSWLRHSSERWRCSCRSNASTSVGRKGGTSNFLVKRFHLLESRRVQKESSF
jgi:hypothetical protein